MAVDPVLDGQVVVITGGGGGIGAALAHKVRASGASVAICDLREDVVEGTVAALRGAPGAGAVFGSAFNIANLDALSLFLDSVEAQVGSIDVLVNNAGVMIVGSFLDETDNTTAQITAVNLAAVLHSSRYVARLFVARGHGHIINVASGAGWIPSSGGVTYTATKFGVVGLSEALALELEATPVHVTVVAPALVRTQMTNGIRNIRGIKASTPQQVADAILRAIERPRPEVFVPRAMGITAKMYRVLPTRLRVRVMRAMSTDTVLLAADPQAREVYRRQIEVD